MSFLPDGSLQHRDRNIFLPFGELPLGTAVFSGVSAVNSATFVPSFVINRPAGALDNDFAVMTLLFDTARSVSSPAGWNLFDTFDVLTSGRARILTRVIQPGDVSWTVNINSDGKNVGCTVHSYTGATEIAVNAKILNAAASASVNFANANATRQQMPAILIHLRNVLATPPFFTFINPGTIGPISKRLDNSTSSPAYAYMVADGTMSLGARNVGNITGSQQASQQYSNAVLLIQ